MERLHGFWLYGVKILDASAKEPKSFEKGQMLIGTNLILQINGVVDLNVDGKVFKLRFRKFKSILMPYNDCESEDNSESGTGVSEEERVTNVGKNLIQVEPVSLMMNVNGIRT
ncbi:hypothetical protein V6N13_129814 [Hibiscus sabdariffa]